MRHFFKRLIRYSLYLLCGGLVLTIGVSLIFKHLGLYFNVSSSLPYGLYATKPYQAIPASFTALDLSQSHLAETTVTTTSSASSSSASYAAALLLAQLKLLRQQFLLSHLTQLPQLPLIKVGADASVLVSSALSQAKPELAANTLPPCIASPTTRQMELTGPLRQQGFSSSAFTLTSLLTLEAELSDIDIPPYKPVTVHRTVMIAPSLVSLPISAAAYSKLSKLRAAKLNTAITNTSNEPRLVLFCLTRQWADFAQQRRYIGIGNCPNQTAPLGKWIVARAGDHVQLTLQGLYVNSKLLPNSQPILQDAQGRSMPLSLGAYTLIEHQVLVSNPELSSFDSRYFGPIDEKQIQAQLQPLWIWEE